MKKLALLFLFVLTCVCTRAAELYTVWDHNSYTLTFYYDNNRTSRTGDDVVLIKPGTTYWAQYGTLVDKIVMDASIKNYQPATLKEFFQNPTYTIWLKNVRSIINLSYLNTVNATGMERMFENMMSLKSVDLSKFNTAKVTSMYHMFANCMALNEVNLTQFNASKVTTTGGMFSGCEKLNSIIWGDGFKTNMIEYAAEMFYSCMNLYSMDLSRFNLTKNKSFYAMFSGCQTLTTVDFGTYKHTAAQNYNELFKDCSSLHHINLDNFVFTNITSTSGIFMMFANCSGLQTITCSQDLTAMPNIANTTHLFDGCTSLKGDNGTKFSTSHVDASYARPDRGTAEPGYFSAGLEPIFVCEAPTNLRTTSVTSNSITITWDAPENHMGWLVFWKKASEQNFKAGGGDDQSFTIIDLQPNTTYEIILQGVCGAGVGEKSDYTESIFITTLAEQKPNPSVEELKNKVEEIGAYATDLRSLAETYNYIQTANAIGQDINQISEIFDQFTSSTTVSQAEEYASDAMAFLENSVQTLLWKMQHETEVSLDALLEEGDSEAVKKIIDDAAKEVFAFKWDYDKTVYENDDLFNSTFSYNWYMGIKGAVEQQRQAEKQGVEEVQGDNVQCTKILRDGQLLLLVGDKTYDAQGAEVK